MIGIYKITEKNNPNNFYIGKSTDIQRRFYEHKQKTYEQSRIPFDGYIKEKGVDAFVYEILEECKLEELSLQEKYWTDKLNATQSGNVFDGGLRDVVGNNNPNAKLCEEDVQIIRQAYAQHLKQKEVYEQFKEKISFGSFQRIWQGKSWAHVMPEVFTEENKQYYIFEQSRGSKSSQSKFTDEEIITIRKRYVSEDAKNIYQDYKDKISYQTFQQILWGRYYNNLPIYKKKEKKWINTEPVSTIPQP